MASLLIIILPLKNSKENYYNQALKSLINEKIIFRGKKLIKI